MTRRSVAILAGALLALAGCARNAIFELEVDLPEQPAGAPIFAVFAASTEPGFEFTSPRPVDSVALPAGCARPAIRPACDDRVLDPACSTLVSVIGHEAEIAEPLHVRIRFCADPDCTDAVGAPEHRVEVERAFYLGRYTQGRVCIDEVPTDPTPPTEVIERCEVRCRDGTAAMSCRLDGTHFCEPP